jgi:hypothetical protein
MDSTGSPRTGSVRPELVEGFFSSLLENSLCLNLYQAAKVVRVRGLASEEILNRARRLCEKLGDDAGLFMALELLADHQGNRLDASDTRSVREELLKVASRINDPSLLARVRLGLGRTFLFEGHVKNAAEQFERVPKQAEGDLATAERSILEWKYSISAWNLWLLGYPIAALLESDKSVAISTAVGSPLVSAHALAGRSALHLLMRNPEGALQSAEAALKICNQEGLSWALQLSGFYRSWALIQRGDAESATIALLGGRTPIRGIAAQIRDRALGTELGAVLPSLGFLPAWPRDVCELAMSSQVSRLRTNHWQWLT